MQPTLRCRPLLSSDVEVLVAWLRRDLPDFCAADPPAAAAIDRLLRREQIKGAVFEEFEGDKGDKGEWRPLSLGVSGFVHPETIECHLAQPQPFLFQTLLSKAAAKAPRLFLDPDDQAPVNGTPGAGLDLVAHWMQRRWDPHDPLWRQVYMMAHENFIQEHRGYRINRMIHEDWVRDVDIYLALGYRVHTTFEISGSHNNILNGSSSRTLYYMDCHEILSQAPGAAASYLLQYVGPVCGFTRAEQRLLRRALDGLTDGQLAAELDLSVNTLKSMWRSIYDRITTNAPLVLSDANADEQETRGREKRRTVLAFIKANPQELRPYGKAR